MHVADHRTPLYHHFGGKEDIAAALYAEGLDGYQRSLLRALRRSDGPREGVRAIVRHHLRWVRRNRAMATFLLAGRDAGVRAASDDRVGELNRRTFAEMRSWQQANTESGALRDLPFELFYAATIGPAQEFTRLWLAGVTTTSIERAERELADTAWAAVCSASPPT